DKWFQRLGKKGLPCLADHGEICTLGRLHGHGTCIQTGKNIPKEREKRIQDISSFPFKNC
ncbi:hypothetical protein DV515_00004356, partial [Chloebia gouldiae]